MKQQNNCEKKNNNKKQSVYTIENEFNYFIVLANVIMMLIFVLVVIDSINLYIYIYKSLFW